MQTLETILIITLFIGYPLFVVYKEFFHTKRQSLDGCSHITDRWFELEYERQRRSK